MTLLAFFVALGILVWIHEWGHYRVARWCGVKILTFSIGFGPALWKRTDSRGTTWQLAALPLGGYVSMLGEGNRAVAAADRPIAFSTQPVLKRMAIVVAGPIANLLLAIFLLAGLAWHGTDEIPTRVGPPPLGTPAQRAGIVAGDWVEKVVNRDVRSWEDLRWAMLQHALGEDRVNVQVRDASGVTRALQLDLSGVTPAQLETQVLPALGFVPPAAQAIVAKVLTGSAAEAAGLRSGDQILSAAHYPIADADELIRAIRRNPGRPLSLTVHRADVSSPINLTVIPETARVDNRVNLSYGRIGAEIGAPTQLVKVRLPPLEALAYGIRRTYELSVFSIRAFGKMLVGDWSWRHLSGPVTIADYAGQTARLGAQYYLGFIAIVSISLGVLNLLPIPVLDGGHLLYYAYEFFRGKPLPEHLKVWGQRLGLSLLLIMMSVALFNDFSRLFT